MFFGLITDIITEKNILVLHTEEKKYTGAAPRGILGTVRTE
jgi:hypothetical protein